MSSVFFEIPVCGILQAWNYQEVRYTRLGGGSRQKSFITAFYWSQIRHYPMPDSRPWFGSNPPITVSNAHFCKLFSFDKEKMFQTQHFGGL